MNLYKVVLLTLFASLAQGCAFYQLKYQRESQQVKAMEQRKNMFKGTTSINSRKHNNTLVSEHADKYFFTSADGNTVEFAILGNVKYLLVDNGLVSQSTNTPTLRPTSLQSSSSSNSNALTVAIGLGSSSLLNSCSTIHIMGYFSNNLIVGTGIDSCFSDSEDTSAEYDESFGSTFFGGYLYQDTSIYAGYKYFQLINSSFDLESNSEGGLLMGVGYNIKQYYLGYEFSSSESDQVSLFKLGYKFSF